MKSLAPLVDRLSGGALVIARLTITAMAVMMVGDVLLRQFFRAPIRGAYEIVGLLGAFSVAFALPYIQRARGHIVTEFLVERLPTRVRRPLAFVTLLLEGLFFVVLTWQFVHAAAAMRLAGQVSDVLHLPYAAVYATLAVAFGLVVLVILQQLQEYRRAPG